MVKKEITIVWSKDASSHFSELLEYLSHKSHLALEIVGNAIVDSIESLPSMPFKHPEDRLRKNNEGNFRALVVYSYRITYYVSENEILILRIRHTSREPLEY